MSAISTSTTQSVYYSHNSISILFQTRFKPYSGQMNTVESLLFRLHSKTLRENNERLLLPFSNTKKTLLERTLKFCQTGSINLAEKHTLADNLDLYRHALDWEIKNLNKLALIEIKKHFVFNPTSPVDAYEILKLCLAYIEADCLLEDLYYWFDFTQPNKEEWKQFCDRNFVQSVRASSEQIKKVLSDEDLDYLKKRRQSIKNYFELSLFDEFTCLRKELTAFSAKNIFKTFLSTETIQNLVYQVSMRIKHVAMSLFINAKIVTQRYQVSAYTKRSVISTRLHIMDIFKKYCFHAFQITLDLKKQVYNNEQDYFLENFDTQCHLENEGLCAYQITVCWQKDNPKINLSSFFANHYNEHNSELAHPANFFKESEITNLKVGSLYMSVSLDLLHEWAPLLGKKIASSLRYNEAELPEKWEKIFPDLLRYLYSAFLVPYNFHSLENWIKLRELARELQLPLLKTEVDKRLKERLIKTEYTNEDVLKGLQEILIDFSYDISLLIDQALQNTPDPHKILKQPKQLLRIKQLIQSNDSFIFPSHMIYQGEL